MQFRRSFLFGCASIVACRARGAARPPTQTEAIYDASGRSTTLAELVRAAADADFIGFGELHDHPVAARLELEMLEALVQQPRPLALALEFFEADMQPDLDAYLAGALDEDELRRRTHRTASYDASHRPLVELCKARRIPVLAANAPRRLVTAYRKSGLDYESWLAGLTEEERAWLPAWTRPPHDEHERRFMELMGPQRGPRLWRSMALWNDAMAQSAARWRESNDRGRVLLVVGAFHVAGRLGTVTQYLARRPDDRAVVLAMIDARDLSFAPADRDQGDCVVKVRPVVAS